MSDSARIEELERRVKALEKHSHEPFDFTHLIERLERVEKYIANMETVSASMLHNMRDAIKRQGK